MALRIHVLTPGFTSPNGVAFLFPLITFKPLLKSEGFDIHFYRGVEDRLYQCDVIIIDSKYYSQKWATQSPQVLDEIASFKKAGLKVIYADISDSTGWVHVKMMDYVDLYMKNQLLKDRRRYLEPVYGYRLFADYYHNDFDITDKDEDLSRPLSEKNLHKLIVGWNSGLSDYSPTGPYKTILYNKVPLPFLLKFPKAVAHLVYINDQSVACRFGVSYNRESVAFQRKSISQKMTDRIGPTNKLKRRAYFREMANSQLVVSPFGLGEITLKDFEAFLVGSALFKPKMDHMETWPDFFVEDETMLTFDWDLEDFEQKLDHHLAKPGHCLEVARAGQEKYLDHTFGQSAGLYFLEHFAQILHKSLGCNK